ncbi:DNA mismatch repair endonuclease MutL [Deltaproteobacteria bacterium TL4]
MSLPTATKIQILPELIINKIAAGEVVERPASVVKELLENSIDAGADQIYVTVKNGGRDLIAVLDNGIGMNEEDARLSIERHATSKIKTEAELDCIQTMGFRGEALAAIASVSQFELITCNDENSGAIRLFVKGGHVEQINKTGFTKGTKISVNQLFFNTPARLKFLKSVNTEFQHIQQTFILQALARPHIQFRLTHNKQMILNLGRGQSLEERIYQLFGEAFLDDLIFTEHQEAYLKYHGFISSPPRTRTSRTWQYLFVNDRSVRCTAVNRGIYEAYQTLLLKNRHPVFFLKLYLAPTEIDVNVHPAKTEIRFRNSQLIQTLLKETLAKTIKDSTHRRFFGNRLGEVLPPANQQQMEIPLDEPFSLQPQTRPSTEPRKIQPAVSKSAVVQEKPFFSEPLKQKPVPGTKTALPPSEPEKAVSDLSPKKTSTDSSVPMQTTERLFNLSVLEIKKPQEYTPLGQLHQRYILAENQEGLVLIDQHAAHERILFEYYRNQFYEDKIKTRSFQVPELLELIPQNAILLEQYLVPFKKLGFSIEPFGGKTYAVHSIPVILPQSKQTQTLLAILDELALFGKRSRQEEIFSDALRIVSCNSALADGEKLSSQDLQTLVAQLEQVDLHLFCPHQRPVLVHLSLDELNSRFKRT